MSRRTHLAERTILQATQVIGPFGGGQKRWENRIQQLPRDKSVALEVLTHNSRHDQWARKPEKLQRLILSLYSLHKRS